MSRQIDLTSALSDEDRQYLTDRGRHSDIARADAVANGEEWNASSLTAGDVIGPNDPPPLPPNTGDVNPVPPEERNQPWGESMSDDETTETNIGTTGGQVMDYEQFTKAQLKAEIERRNEALEEGAELLPHSGNKAELIAVLEQDDAAGDGSDGDDSGDSEES